MNIVTSFILCAFLAPTLLFAASTPEQLVEVYFDAFRKGDLASVADQMHEEDLVKFKETLLPVIKQNLELESIGFDREAIAVRQFAGGDAMETITGEEPRLFFLRFLKWMTRLNPNMIRAMDGSRLEALGHISEKDMAHVVCRITIDMMGAQVTQMKVMTARRFGDEWRLTMTGEIEGMANLMQASSPR